MIAELSHYVDPSYTYNFNQGPQQILDEAEALEKGLNCVALAYLAIERLYSRKLWPRLNCYETYIDRDRFETVSSLGEVVTGDLVWFSGKESCPVDSFVARYDPDGYLLNWRYSPVSHVAIYTGETAFEYGEDPLMLHATDIVGGVDIWPLWRFSLIRRYGYGNIRRISRYIP